MSTIGSNGAYASGNLARIKRFIRNYTIDFKKFLIKKSFGKRNKIKSFLIKTFLKQFAENNFMINCKYFRKTFLTFLDN